MFTGIVSGTCEVVSVAQETSLNTLVVELGRHFPMGLRTGASISIDGVCLSATRIADTQVTFEAIRETLDRTTLATVKVGQKVNVERSMSAADEIGGHRVSGHIHGIAHIVSVHKQVNERILTIHTPSEWMKYIMPKGFIALDGASLTVVDVNRPDSSFTIHLIPETLRTTTLAFKLQGDRVNLEVDSQTQAIVDTVERIMAERNGLVLLR